MFTPRSLRLFILAMVVGAWGATTSAAEKPAAGPVVSPCKGSPFLPAAAVPRFKLLPIRTTPEGPLLNWESVPAAKEYHVFREPFCPRQARTLVATLAGNATTWTHSGEKVQAWYSVEAATNAGSALKPLSNTAEYSPGEAAPAAAAAAANSSASAESPQAAKYAQMKLLSIKPTAEGPLLTWEGVAGTKEYRVSREFPGTGRNEQIASTPGNVTNWTDKGQAGRALYSVKSVPNDSKLPMGASNAIEFIPGAPPAPRALGLPLPVAAGVKTVLGTAAPTKAPQLTAPPPGVSTPPATLPSPPPVPAKAAVGALPQPLAPPPPPPAVTASVATATAIDTVEQAFSFDDRSPSTATLGLGLTQAGTVQVRIRWTGATELQLALGEAGQGAPLARQSVRGGQAQAQFQLTAEQVKRSVLWSVTVTGVPGVSGTLTVSHPKSDAKLVEHSVAQSRTQLGAKLPQARAQMGAKLSARIRQQLVKSGASLKSERAPTPLGAMASGVRSAVSTATLSTPGLSGPGQVTQSTALTAPVIQSLRAVGGGAILPRSKLVIEGKGLASGQKVHLIWPVHSGEDVLVAAVGPGPDTVVVQLPDGAGFAAPVNVPVWVEGAGALMSNKAQFSLTPEREAIELDLREFTSELIFDHGGFLLFEPVLRPLDEAIMDPVGSTKFSGLPAEGVATLGPLYQPKMIAIDAERLSIFWYLGFKGDDEFFKNTQLKNGWTVQTVFFEGHGDGIYASGNASLLEHRTGTASLYAKVHWWYEPTGYATYRLGYVIEGPKGVPYR